MAFATGPSGQRVIRWKLRSKVLRQSPEESCDGYPKGGSKEVQSTCRYPVFAKFILLDLLAADTHQGSQCFQAQGCLKPSLSKAVADIDVYWMNFCPLGGPVHWPIVLHCASAAARGHRWRESGARCLESGRRIFPGVRGRSGDPTCRTRGSADEQTRFHPQARTRPIHAHPGKWQPLPCRQGYRLSGRARREHHDVGGTCERRHSIPARMRCMEQGASREGTSRTPRLPTKVPLCCPRSSAAGTIADPATCRLRHATYAVRGE